MADRRRQLVQLLATRYDGLYLPAGALRTPSGLAPGEKRPCPDCGHTEHPGWHVDAFKRRTPCGKCGGTLEPRKRGKGFVFVDPMDANEVPIGSAETAASARPRKTVECDACGGDGVRLGLKCVYCDGVGRRDFHVFELAIARSDDEASSGDPMTDAIEARNASGSYRELELALAGIRVHVNKPSRFHWLTINATWALRLLDELTLDADRARDLARHTYPAGYSPTAKVLVEAALDYLDWRMPSTLRVPAAVSANDKILAERRTRARGKSADPNALRQRAREMQVHARQGRSPQWIAAEYGVSVSTVYEVVRQSA